jgi:hypothetical protein
MGVILLLAVRNMQELGVLHGQFPGVSGPSYFSQAFNPYPANVEYKVSS